MTKIDTRDFIRIRLNRSEVRALVQILEKIDLQRLSNFYGERQSAQTITTKLIPAIKKLENEN